MKTLKIQIALLLLYPVLSSFIKGNAYDTGEALIKLMPDSTLEIQGKTNVNKFNCIFEITNIDDPLKVNFQESENALKFRNTQLLLDNDCFDCGNNMMNKDLRKLLKSDEFPHIKLGLVEVHKTSQKNQAMAEVDISLAGNTKRYLVPVNVSGANQLSYSGSMDLDINDFELEAPKKLMGAVKVSNIIKIVFDLKVASLPN
ncbi:YceI family protein [Paucihalobacter ruber]|uniref:YceI family protein n=1 Tax=Paucihalobacter ruber TaxID=2567861 RepID=A0A506PL83_9FLAO|nr:YceI family protein [Paucihalobacter ruber]TPV33962.1 YceI family protein [Paucihalobacter ruber]